MKILVTTAILALAATAGAASAQVYGTNDDPYSQNPFASSMNLPDAAPTAPATAAPASTPPAQPPQDSAKTQQTAASSGSSSGSVTNTAATKPAQP